MIPSVKPLGRISTLAPIRMFDLSWALALIPSVKWVFYYVQLCDSLPILGGNLFFFINACFNFQKFQI
jgi:hypothetical protein